MTSGDSTSLGSGVLGTDSVNTMRHPFAIVRTNGLRGNALPRSGLCTQPMGRWSPTAPALEEPADVASPICRGVWGSRGSRLPVPGVQPAPPAAPGLGSASRTELIHESFRRWVAGERLPLQPWVAQLRSERFATNSKEHPDAHFACRCIPRLTGFTAILSRVQNCRGLRG